MHERFEKRIDEALEKVQASCQKRKWKKEVIDRRIGKIMAKNSRAAGLFEVEVKQVGGRAVVSWTKNEKWRDWATLSEGCYLLRTNVTDWSAEDLWQAYIQLTEAEAAFRIHKSDLRIRPVWHQKEDRVLGPHPGLLPGLRVVENAAPDGQGRPAWATSLAESSTNSARSAWSTWCSPPATARKSAAAASAARPITKRSSSTVWP